MTQKIEIVNQGEGPRRTIRVLWYSRSDGPHIHYLGIGTRDVKNNYAKLSKLKMKW